MIEFDDGLKKIQDTLEKAWKVPFLGGKAFVNVEKVMQLLFSIRESLPKEIDQAKKIVSDRSKILNDAKDEAKKMLQSAEEKIRQMLTKDELLKRAKEVAETLVKESRNEAREIKKATSNYIENVTRNAEKSLTEGISSIREVRRKLKSIRPEENQ